MCVCVCLCACVCMCANARYAFRNFDASRDSSIWMIHDSHIWMSHDSLTPAHHDSIIWVGHDSIICVGHDSCICVSHDSFICVGHDLFIRVTHSYDLFIRVTHSHINATHTYKWFMTHIWMSHDSHMKHSLKRGHAYLYIYTNPRYACPHRAAIHMCGSWLIHMWVMTHSYVWVAFMYGARLFHTCKSQMCVPA